MNVDDIRKILVVGTGTMGQKPIRILQLIPRSPSIQRQMPHCRHISGSKRARLRSQAHFMSSGCFAASVKRYLRS